VAIPGLPFDERAGTIPHEQGRIADRDNDYVVGWIKRGPSGVIGTNKSDSQDTVNTLVADLASAQLRDVEPGYADELAAWLLEHQPELITDDHWLAIDTHERSAGEPYGRPRVKVSKVADLLRIARG
jgi:ferredoxin--NADP+ reductase